MHNVHEDSDAYTYIKSLLRHRNGRRDILALRERYSSEATRQAIINAAKATLENLRYKNERNFSFEKFSSKLQKAYDELADNGREVNNGDIVDALWNRIQSPDLQIYINTLKVNYQQNHRSYKLILQDIASEVASKKSVSFATGTGRNISAMYTRQGPCPNQGVHMPDGTVFIGSYPAARWNSDTVQPHRQEIINARGSSQDGSKNENGNQSRSAKRRINAVQRNKKKLQKLNSKIAVAKATLKTAQLSLDDNNEDDDSDSGNAGDAFGGKNSKRK